ncbi:restriction endonuclease subunit S [Clostridioides difficile]|nr:restriction endonuclease subunit S [Clostridioides difficile]
MGIKRIKVKEFAEIISGSTPKTNIDEYWNGEFRWITPAEIKEKSKYIYSTARNITKEGIDSCSLRELKENTVLLTSRAPIGKVALVGKTMYCNQGFKNLICNEKIVNPVYIYYWLSSQKEYLNSLGRGATFKEISKKIVEDIEVPIQELEKQDKIVEVLDKAEELINKRKEQIEALDELVKSRFIEIFGDISKNTMGWDVTKLDELVDVIGGYAFKSTEFTNEGIPVLKIGNINAGYFKATNLMFWKKNEKLNRYLIKPEDLVISLTGTVGKDDYGNVCIMSNDYEEYYLNQRNAKLDIKNENLLDKYYLTYALKIPEVKKKLTGISRGIRQANIANKDIQNLELPIPPIELQKQLTNFVNQVDKLKSKMEASLKELEDNFNSLMQKSFKGELFN